MTRQSTGPTSVRPVPVVCTLTIPSVAGVCAVALHLFPSSDDGGVHPFLNTLTVLMLVGLLSIPCSAVTLGYAAVVTAIEQFDWRSTMRWRSGRLVWGIVAICCLGAALTVHYFLFLMYGLPFQ